MVLMTPAVAPESPTCEGGRLWSHATALAIYGDRFLQYFNSNSTT